jgi:hypothetical protein
MNYFCVGNPVAISLASSKQRKAVAILSRPSGANLGSIAPAACQGMGMATTPKSSCDVKCGMNFQGIDAGELFETAFLPFHAYPQKEAVLHKSCLD